jgi:hypothetical protein
VEQQALAEALQWQLRQIQSKFVHHRSPGFRPESRSQIVQKSGGSDENQVLTCLAADPIRQNVREFLGEFPLCDFMQICPRLEGMTSRARALAGSAWPIGAEIMRGTRASSGLEL